MRLGWLPSLCAAALAVPAWADAEGVVEWERLPDLPNAEGFAGVFAGVVRDGEEDLLVVAGGANFPSGRPWEGGRKVYHDQVSVLVLGDEPAWRSPVTRWPVPIAYGMSVSLPERNSCLFVGGKNVDDTSGKERALSLAWEVRIENGEVVVEDLPPLPVPCVEGVAGVVGSKVVVAAGATNLSDDPEHGLITSRRVFVLDTEAKREDWAWIDQGWPASARGRMYAVAGVRGDSFYLFGGRDFADSEGEAPNRFEGLDWLADSYALEVPTRTWRRLADLPEARSAAPATAIPSGASHLLFLGGVSVPFLREQVAARPALNGQGFEHPGFPASILAYDTVTDTWAEAGQLPVEVRDDHAGNAVASTWPVVTTPVVDWDGKFLIPTGEIKPGVRSPQVLLVETVEERADLGLVNWMVVGVYLLAMVAIGYWFMKRKAAATTEAYFRGGQHIPFLVAGLSIFATVLSSITFMSIPARAYTTDMTWYIGQLTMLLIVPIVAFCYLPFFRKLDLTSAYLYLERRFNLAVRLFGSISFMILHLGRIAIVLYLPAVALAAVSNLDVNTAILVVGVLCVIYTVMGGIEAVVWTDAVQAVVLMGGAILCLVLVVANVDGGLGAIMDTARSDAKLFQGLTLRFDVQDGTTTVYVLLVAFFFNSFVQYTSGQDVIQRYVTTRDEAAARKSLWTTMWMSVFGSFVFFALGVALYAFYKSKPDLLDPALPTTDAILPFFILGELPVGVSGLIIAAVFAASQSSVSSSLNSIATAWTKDFDARLFRPSAGDRQLLRGAKVVVLLAGVTGIGIAIMMANAGIENAFKAFLAIVGLSSGALGGVFGLGVFTRRGNGTGAVVGALVAIATVTGLKFGGAPVSGLLYAFIGFATCLVVGYGVSLVAGRTSRQSEGLSVHG